MQHGAAHLVGLGVKCLLVCERVGRIHRRFGDCHIDVLCEVAAGAAGICGIVAGTGALSISAAVQICKRSLPVPQ